MVNNKKCSASNDKNLWSTIIRDVCLINIRQSLINKHKNVI